VSVDPLVDKTHDAYGYGNNSPVTYIDPSGLYSVDSLEHHIESGNDFSFSTNTESLPWPNDVHGPTDNQTTQSTYRFSGGKMTGSSQTYCRLSHSCTESDYGPKPSNPLTDPRTIAAIARLMKGGNEHTVGACGGASAHFVVVTASGSICFGNTAATGAWGAASIFISGQLGGGFNGDAAIMTSNAEVPEDMGGYSVCGGFAVAAGAGVSAIACVSTTDDLELPDLADGKEPTVIIFAGRSFGADGQAGPVFGVQKTWVWRIHGSSAPPPYISANGNGGHGTKMDPSGGCCAP
jgi:hypothetical protein